MPWFIALLIGIALQVVAYLLTPQPKQQKPAAAQDADDPTAEAGKPLPVVFGSLTVNGINVMWFGDKSKHTFSVSS